MVHISPQYTDESFERPWTIETKIEIFLDRTMGWQLDIADQMINGDVKSEPPINPIEHSGFAALQVLFSYFEMFGKYEDGYTGEGRSAYYFRRGVIAVWPDFNLDDKLSAHITRMYKHGRNGLYHNAATGSRIVIWGGFHASLGLGDNRLTINPHRFVKQLIIHFLGYITKLKNPDNVELRERFERRFDIDVKD